MRVASKEFLTKKKVLAVLATLTILNIADLITTLISLNTGIYEELNVIIRQLYSFSPAIMIAYKIAMPLLPFVFLFKYLNQRKSALRNVIANSIFIAMIFDAIAYTFVVFHNIILLTHI